MILKNTKLVIGSMILGILLVLIDIQPDFFGFVSLFIFYPFFAFTLGYAIRKRQEEKRGVGF